nr:hypothetical protein LTR18_001482 [Exophiala xenobiotica]
MASSPESLPSSLESFLFSEEEIKEELCNTLSQITGPGAFACAKPLSGSSNPGLDLLGHGPVEQPLSDRDVQAIIANARQSPFGKGVETLVDTSVRKSWQLEPSQFWINNVQWNSILREIIGEVYVNLGLTGGAENISAQLYKLLLYEKGAFFKPHKDSEKTPGMSGTLVICLSSAHEGGDIVLTHNHETMTIPSSGMSWAAWYSDVLHEVKPVTSGHRLVLTYNLVRQGRSPGGLSVAFGGQYDRLVYALRHYDTSLEPNRSGSPCPQYLIHQLSHQYTQIGLRADRLKGSDLGQVQCLQKAAAELGFALYLANMERVVVRDDEANVAYKDHYGYGDWYNDEEESDGQISMSGEELSHDVYFEFVARLDGTRVDDPERRYGRICVDKEAMLDLDSYEERAPDGKERSGFTGNEGCTATYWYRDTVLVIVPPSKRGTFLFNCDAKGREVESWMKSLQKDADSDGNKKQELIGLCKEVIAMRLLRGPHAREPFRIALMHQTALAALQVDKLHLFDKAITDITDPLPDNIYRELGRLMARVRNSEPVQSRVASALVTARSLDAKFRALQTVDKSYREALSADDLDKKIVRDSVWSNDEMLEGLVEQVDRLATLRKVDGRSLGVIAAGWKVLDVRERIIPRLLIQGAACKAAFANVLLTLPDPTTYPGSPGSADDLPALFESLVDRQDVCKTVYDSIWTSFGFESEETVARLNPPVLGQQKLSGSEWAIAYEETLLDGGDLADLLNNTFDLQIATEDYVNIQLTSAIKSADTTAFMYSLLPFIRAILEQKVVVHRLDTDVKASPQSINLVTLILQEYIARYMDGEPQAPSDWALPTRGCGCADCGAVNRFLTSPTERVGRFPMNKNRRYHLHRYFNNLSDAQYTIDTLRNSNPNIWQISKHRKQHSAKHKAWKGRLNDVRARIEALQRAGSLTSYLGDMSEAIASYDVDRIRIARARAGFESSTDQAVIATPSLPPPLQDMSPNSRPASVLRGSKRWADDQTTADGAKRARPNGPPDICTIVQTPRGAVEIIDLTVD